MNLKHSCLMSSSRTHRTRPLLQQTGMPRQLCPTADAQLHAAANAAATSCDHHGGIHFELGIDPEARLLLTLQVLDNKLSFVARHCWLGFCSTPKGFLSGFVTACKRQHYSMCECTTIQLGLPGGPGSCSYEPHAAKTGYFRCAFRGLPCIVGGLYN